MVSGEDYTPSFLRSGGTIARAKEFAEKSTKQIPRGLKPNRNDKNKGLCGTAEAVPFQNTGNATASTNSKAAPFSTPAGHDFISKLLSRGKKPQSSPR